MDHNKSLAYACYFLLGSGILAPWNAFITAADYYELVYPGRHVDRLLTVAYLPVCLVVLGMMVKFSKVAVRQRILASFAGFSLIMLVVPLVDRSLVGDAPSGPDSALTVLVLSVVVTGVLDGISQGAIFSDVAALPPTYTHAVVGGTASSGVIICCLRILTKATLPATSAGLRQSTGIYFGISGAICLLCWCIYYAVLPHLSVVKHHRQKGVTVVAGVQLGPPSGVAVCDHSRADHDELGDDVQRLLVVGPSMVLSDHGQHITNNTPKSKHDEALFKTNTPDIPSSIDTTFLDPQIIGSSTPVSQPRQQQASDTQTAAVQHAAAAAAKQPGGCLAWRCMAAQTWRLALAMFFLYAVTLFIFPGVLAEDAQSERLGSWYPVILITIFNLCDFVGKNIPLCGMKPPPQLLLMLTLVRGIVLLPLFTVARKFTGPTGPGVMAVLTTALGFTNGLMTALLMTLAPVSVRSSDVGLVENVMVFCLVAGLTVGAFAGWLWLL